MSARHSLPPIALAAALALTACADETPASTSGSQAAADAPADAGPRGPDHGEYALKIKFLRGQLADKKKCDKKTALDVSKYLNKAHDYDGNVAFVEEFASDCGKWHRHLWSAAYAREQQKRWDDAAAIDSELIENKPLDSDFWWWRGRAHGESNKKDKADADFRQSLANKPTGYPAFRHAKYVGDTFPCASAFMIQWWIEHGKKVEDWASEKRSEHYLKGGCAKLEGKGRANIPIKPNAPTISVKAKVNGKSGAFLLAERSAFVTVSRAFAQKAGIDAQVPVDPVVVFNTLLPATVGEAKEVAVGKAKAPRVKVAVVESLPGDIDGVIGLSYLWRFATERSPKSLKLKAR